MLIGALAQADFEIEGVDEVLAFLLLAQIAQQPLNGRSWASTAELRVRYRLTVTF